MHNIIVQTCQPVLSLPVCYYTLSLCQIFSKFSYFEHVFLRQIVKFKSHEICFHFHEINKVTCDFLHAALLVLKLKWETWMCDFIGIYHSAGKCLSNGRCLCWWGWTGSGACYVDGGAYNNRIIVSDLKAGFHLHISIIILKLISWVIIVPTHIISDHAMWHYSALYSTCIHCDRLAFTSDVII